MDKENDNAAGRLGSEYHYESGSEEMRSVPETAGGNEPGASESEAEDQGILLHYSAAIATVVGFSLVSFILIRMWDEDEVRLYVLNKIINLLQTIARLCGSWALECERTYNEYVDALH